MRQLASHLLTTFLIAEQGRLEEELIFAQLFVLNDTLLLRRENNVERGVLSWRIDRLPLELIVLLSHALRFR